MKKPGPIIGTMKGMKNPSYKHGHNMRGKRSDEYEIWVGIRKRCFNEGDKLFHHYGGRGVTMCDDWRDSFSVFLTDMGQRPSKKHSIERKNNNEGYSKSNCKWALRIEQARNKRNNIRVLYNGVDMCLKELCINNSLPYKNVWRRIKQYGWSVDKATGLMGATLGKEV